MDEGVKRYADSIIVKQGDNPDPADLVMQLIDTFGSMSQLERLTGLNKGHYSIVANGGNSPALNALFYGKRRFTRRRWRRCADFPDEQTVVDFDAMLASRGTTLTKWMQRELGDWLEQIERTVSA